jgi:hypothetical protein
MSEYRSPEADLYPVVQSFLNIRFAPLVKPPHGTQLPLVAITATAGPAASGMWSRPDLAMINVWRHKYQPVSTIDLYGFEVKRDEACDLKSVHETLAHRRLVHFAYLVWHYKKADFSAEGFKVIRANCQSYGLGLITIGDPKDGTTFLIHLDASRATPDAADVDDFIETRFPEHQKSRLLEWIGARR